MADEPHEPPGGSVDFPGGRVDHPRKRFGQRSIDYRHYLRDSPLLRKAKCECSAALEASSHTRRASFREGYHRVGNLQT